MKNGICTSCKSATVHTKQDGLKYVSGHGVVFVHTSMLTRASPAIAYVCTTCGYFENHISDPAKLAEVAKNWPRVPAHE